MERPERHIDLFDYLNKAGPIKEPVVRDVFIQVPSRFPFFISVIHSPKPIQAQFIHNGPGSSVNTDLNWTRMKSWNRLQAVRENLIYKRKLYEFHAIKNLDFGCNYSLPQ